MPNCPFCTIPKSQIIISNPVAIAFRDGFPVSDGHTLVVPRIHVESLFDLSLKDQALVWALVAEVREVLKKEYQPSGFNIGINDGAAAGQTVGHTHVHIIPRYAGDVKDPRGGIRWVFPDKAKYWQ
jgi:diadenosine tetraphosphate (Ap4A) HIT family hydrolase